VAPLGYSSQPVPQMKAIPEWYASQSQVFHSFVLSSFWTSAFTLTEWVKWLRKHRQLYDSPLDPKDFGCLFG